MKICFLLTHIPNPRINKRIGIFKKNGDEVSVICVRRKTQNIWEPLYKDIKHYIYEIDLPSIKHLIKRVIVSQKYKSLALEKLKEIQPDIIYTEGLDSLLIAKKYKMKNNIKVYFEVADLRENYIKKPTNLVGEIITRALFFKEKQAFKVVDYLIVTSLKFYEVHYKNLISKEKMIFIPNAPNRSVFKNYKQKESGSFTVGFIGGIRYIDQMKMLVDAAEVVKCNVLFAGAGGSIEEYDKIIKYCEGKKYVTFFGKYKYDEEIANLYKKVDCVYAVYDASNPNVCIALPNKLYESVLCSLPIIVAKNTYLSEVVKEWGVGISVQCDSKENLILELKKLMINTQYYSEICTNCKKILTKGEIEDKSYLLLNKN